MRVAILSDIHGNFPALEKVVAHALRAGVDAWWFLGDLIGYGPYVVECWQLLEPLLTRDGAWLAGNHDQAACLLSTLDGPCYVEELKSNCDWQVSADESFLHLIPYPEDQKIAMWHAQQLRHWLTSPQIASFRERPNWVKLNDGIVLAHGAIMKGNEVSTYGPTDYRHVSRRRSYIYPGEYTKIEASLQAASAYLKMDIHDLRLLITGHTHKPMLHRACSAGHAWTWEDEILRPSADGISPAISLGFDNGRSWASLNPGSVGQPRDKDPRAAYAIVDFSKWELTIRVMSADYVEFSASER